MNFRPLLSAAVALGIAASTASAQWVTESYPLLAGWNGVWLSQDCSYAPLDTLLAGYPQIQEVWQWNPLASTTQFVTSPGIPIAPDISWKVWRRGLPADTTLTSLVGNAGYLVKVATGSLNFTLPLTGQPLLPGQTFKSSGLNFIGFPTLTPDSSSLRNIEAYFSYSAILKTNPPVFGYRGGALSEVSPKNPVSITTPRTTPLSRGKAYWINGTVFTDYYGPIRVTILGGGINFGDALNTATVRLKNVIDPSRNLSVTATLAPAASAIPPTGQTPIAGTVPLLVRGPRDPQTLQYTYTALTAPITRTLAPGEEVDVVLALNRSALGSTAGAVFQSLLQISDSLNLSRVDLGVRAVSTSFTGLWVGAAVLTQVDQIIGQTTQAAAAAPSNYPIRLIVHRASSGVSTLLQTVYLGKAAGTSIASASEAPVLGASTQQPSRLTSASFPLDLAMPGAGQLGPSGPLTFNVALGYNARTNPFVHTYHPDHDNLDARGEMLLPAGVESYNITRAITLNFTPAGAGASDPTLGSTSLSGTYSETITGLRATPITVSGAFVLRRISDVQTLLP